MVLSGYSPDSRSSAPEGEFDGQYLDTKAHCIYPLGEGIVVLSFDAHFRVYLPAKVRRDCLYIETLSAEEVFHFIFRGITGCYLFKPYLHVLPDLNLDSGEMPKFRTSTTPAIFNLNHGSYEITIISDRAPIRQ